MTTDQSLPALIRTKLHRPPLPPDWVSRPNLLDRLYQQRERPLVLVSAPAGFGKSTLIAAWLEHCAWRSAWLSLDDDDNQLATFLSYLIAAIQTLFPEFGTETEALLSSVNLPPVPVLVSSLSNELDELDEPFVLALDDYHVIHTAAIHDLWTKLLSHPPRALHLVLAARHDPPLPIDALRAQAALGEIRSEDLRFSLQETRAFMQQTLATPVDEAQAALLQAKVEGWAAGLRLVALSAWHKNGAAQLTKLFSTDLPLMNYLVGEVLAQQPAALQDVLLKTSILERLNNALCEAVAQESQLASPGKSYLDWLTERNLFIQPLDDEQEWFRYHHLFRRLLLQQLERRFTRDEIAALHQRASRWFAAHDLLEEALQHAALANDTASAAEIVTRHCHALMNQDEWRRLEDLLQALPAAVVEAHPELLLATAWIADNNYQLPQMPGLIDRAEALIAQQALEPAVARVLQGEVAFFRAYFAFWTDNLPHVLPYAQQALADLPLEWWHARALARLYLAAAHHMLGDRASVEALLAAGLHEAQANQRYLMRSFMINGFIHWFAGDLQRLADAANQILALSTQQRSPQTVNWARYFRGIVHYHRNQLADAAPDLLAVVLDRYHAYLNCVLHSAIALTLTYQAQQKPDQALTIAEMLPTYLYEMGNTFLLPTLHAFQADLALRQGRLVDASQWAARAQPADLSLMPLFFAQHVVLPKALLALSTPDTLQPAAEQLARMREFAASRQLFPVLIEVLAVEAMLFATQGDRTAALAALTRAIELAQPGGFMRPFVDLGAPMQALLRQLPDQGVAAPFVAKILAAFDASQPIGSATSVEASALIESLTPRELEILNLLEQRLSNKEIAARLFISPHTVTQHTLHIYQKLQVNTRRAAVAKAQILGLLARP